MIANNFRLVFAYNGGMAKPTDQHRVYMSFMRSHGWYCQFLEVNLRTSLPRKLNFATSDKVIKSIERGGVYLNLTDEQYANLTIVLQGHPRPQRPKLD